MRYLTLFLSVILIASAGYAQKAVYEQIYDVIDAREWCDRNPLGRVEGIWVYPEDNVTVLIRHDDLLPDRYNIISLDNAGSQYNPGEVIGYLLASTDPKKFMMNLFTSRKKNILSDPKDCAVTLSADDYAMKVTKKRLKISFNPLFLLPRFWRIIRISTNDVSSEIPMGMKKIYPSYDKNGSSRFNARYL